MLRKILAAGAALFLLGMTAFGAVIGPGAYTADVPAVLPGGIRNSVFSAAPENAELFLILETEGQDGVLSAYRRDCGEEPVLTAVCRIGANGAGKEREGDKKTPLGLYELNTPFGIRAAEEGFPENYRRVTEYDYWSGSRGERNNNRLMDIRVSTDFDKKGGEHLIDYPGYYDYALNISWNAEGSYGKGSAIFLHCCPYGETTGGCVALPEDAVKEVLRLYREGASYILIREKQ